MVHRSIKSGHPLPPAVKPFCPYCGMRKSDGLHADDCPERLEPEVRYLPSRTHEEDIAVPLGEACISYPELRLPPDAEWQEEWCFNLDQENKAEIRGYVQFGGRLGLNSHFMPRAADVCREHNLNIVKVEGFKASVNLNDDLYSVSALVTLKTANPS